MDTYPIAGQVIETRLFFGLTARDIGQVLILPLLILGIAQSIGISGDPFLWLGGAGFAIGLGILLITPSAQTPLGYARASAQYYLGTTSFRHRQSEHDRPRGVYQDVVETRAAGLTVEDMPAAEDE
jgi:membrane protein implicated in regulation of membrane protease activity